MKNNRKRQAYLKSKLGRFHVKLLSVPNLLQEMLYSEKRNTNKEDVGVIPPFDYNQLERLKKINPRFKNTSIKQQLKNLSKDRNMKKGGGGVIPPFEKRK